MIVFEIHINGKQRAVSAIDAGVMSFVVDKLERNGTEEIKVRLGGYEQKEKKHLDWINESLKENDEIKLVVRRSQTYDEISIPISFRDEKAIGDLILQSKLKSYEVLQKELREKGLI